MGKREIMQKRGWLIQMQKHITGHLFISGFHKNYRQKEESIGSIPDALVWFGLVLLQACVSKNVKKHNTVHCTSN